MKKSIRLVLANRGWSGGPPAPAFGPSEIITLGIGTPSSIAFFILAGLNPSPVVPGPEMIIVGPDSVFATRELVESEYAGRNLWADARVPGEPTVWDQFVSAARRVIGR